MSECGHTVWQHYDGRCRRIAFRGNSRNADLNCTGDGLGEGNRSRVHAISRDVIKFRAIVSELSGYRVCLSKYISYFDV